MFLIEQMKQTSYAEEDKRSFLQLEKIYGINTKQILPQFVIRLKTTIAVEHPIFREASKLNVIDALL